MIAALLVSAATAVHAPLPAPPLAMTVASTVDDGHATEWPKADDSAKLKRSISKLRKARNEAMESAGREEIAAAGPAAAPILLKALAKEKDAETRERLSEALDSVTTKEHTRLLAELFDDKSIAVSRYSVRRVAMLGDAGLREQAEARYAGLEEADGDPKAKRKPEPIDFDLAAVLCMSTGSAKGFDRVLALAEIEPWQEWRGVLIPAARSASGSKEILTEISRVVRDARNEDDYGGPGTMASAPAHVAGLHLITYVGTKENARFITFSLDNQQNDIQVAAINACRVMVDGDEPLEKLSTSDAMKRAGAWKKRLASLGR
ncbi:MAG: hypothetical protein AAGA20_20330 [Planctomycetota bacterium]